MSTTGSSTDFYERVPTFRGGDPRRRASGCESIIAAKVAAPGCDLEARASRRADKSIRVRKAKGTGMDLFYFVVMRVGLQVGRFVPKKYSGEVIENSDFRKFDDCLRMVLDCSPELATKIENCSKGRGCQATSSLWFSSAAGCDDDVFHAVAVAS